MTSSGFERARLGVWLAITLAGAVIGYLYISVAYPPSPESGTSAWLGVVIGMLIGASTAAFELFFVSHPYSAMRRFSFIPAFLFRVLAQFALISLSIALVQIAHDWIWNSSLFDLSGQGVIDHLKDVSFSLVVSAVVVFYMQMRLYLGGTTLSKLVLGVYNNPVAQDRIFLILDIPGTTSAAQQIGDTRFHRYISQLFILFDPAIVRNGGEIHTYVGDAVIAVWPLSTNPRRNSRVLKALAQVLRTCRANESRIEALFGIKPGVRAAIHAGNVVVGETGYSKRQITYLGDVMNIASRIESKTKELERPFLISRPALDAMEMIPDFRAEPAGFHAVKGSRSKVELFELKAEPAV
ncbi:MAG: adenylate/guanylate cyclase domain-containing protein [Rhizobiaceae bacterium]